MLLEEIRKALLDLTYKRRLATQHNDTLSRMFAPLTGTKVFVSFEEIAREVEELQALIGSYYVWYENVHKRYVLVPKEDSEVEG